MPGLRLCIEEREEIRAGIERDESLKSIARRLSRDPSTICREVARNGGCLSYRAARAQERADTEARRPKPFKLVADRVLAAEVEELMTETRYSPQVCARILAGRGRRVSHETIYRACYQPGRGLSDEMWKCLPRRRQRRKHAGRKWGIASRNPLGEPVLVHERHPIALERVQPGHLEGDLICGRRNQSAVLTLCERTTRYTWLGALPDGYGTWEVALCLTQLLNRIPPQMRRTLTWDQGRELKFWADIQAETGTLIYFCDPHSPWQRPTAENNNGILRRWLPKSTPLDIHTQDDLNQIAELINHMPRQLHHWRSANDLYHDHLVATTS